ncbi:MAG: hypothetical protein ACRDNW_19085 [Trebonia sp.]
MSAKILGPHFEGLARQWCLRYADERTLGGLPGAVRPTEVACREHQGGHELDLVVTDAPGGKSQILAIGEAKGTNAAVGQAQLRRLEHLRGLLPSARVDRPPKLLLFSRSGFTPGLTDEAITRPDVELVTLERVYQGS